MSEEIDAQPDGEMVFTAPDLGRDRPPEPARPVAEFGFTTTPRAKPDPGGAPPPPRPAAAPAPLVGTSFRLNTSSAAPATVPDSEPPWMLREPAGQAAAPESRQGWGTRTRDERPSQQPDRATDAIMLRLREEAVDVSWKAASIAVGCTDPGLQRRRRA